MEGVKASRSRARGGPGGRRHDRRGVRQDRASWSRTSLRDLSLITGRIAFRSRGHIRRGRGGGFAPLRPVHPGGDRLHLMALCIFLFRHADHKVRRPHRRAQPRTAPVPLLLGEIDTADTRCPHCTRAGRIMHEARSIAGAHKAFAGVTQSSLTPGSEPPPVLCWIASRILRREPRLDS